MARRRAPFVAALTIVALVVALALPAYADDEIQLSESATAPGGGPAIDETAELWFVELASPPAAKGSDTAALHREHEGFRLAAGAAGIAFEERFAFQTLWNGFSLKVSRVDLARLATLSSVKALYPVDVVAVPTTLAENAPDLATAVDMTGADAAQAAGWTGAGIRVALMDTGIDYHHPDFGGCFGAGCRVVTGRDFVGDGFNASGTTPQQTVPRPDNDPDDCNGHGTHVAGIIGANGDPASGGVRGVAPGVVFGAYRVFGCAGTTTVDLMIAAMERALADGMHVLNMSIGSPFQWPTYPTAVAANNLVDLGMVVVASIGNEGTMGRYSAGAPGIGEKVIGVASFDNTHVSALSFVVNPSGQRVGYLPLATTPTPPTSGTTPEIVFVGRGCPANSIPPSLSNSADPYLADPAGKVALIERGACTFNSKYQRAADAGALGVLVHNNVPGIFLGGGVVSRNIFGVGISQADGLHIRSLAAPALTWTDVRISVPNQTANLASSFTSWGLAPDLALKPDIGAPGGLIRSTFPLERGGYTVLSGTSMSSPHVVGAAALYLQAHPGTTPAAIRTALQNSADPRILNFNSAPLPPFLEPVHRQGAGMLDIPGAIDAKTVVAPSKIALGESVPSATQTKALTITNTGSSAVTYSFAHQPAVATAGTAFASGLFVLNATVAFSPTSLTLAPGASGTVNATITAPAGTFLRQYGGYLVATGGGQTFRVPYAGFRGDYQSIAALTPTSNGFPWLARRVAVTTGPITDWEKQGAGAVFTLKHHADVPWVLFHLDHQVSRLTIDVYRVGTTVVWGRALDLRDFRRNTSASSFFAFSWDAKAASLTSPRTLVAQNGDYFMRLTVVKALGDPNNPAHVQSWDSPVFAINREIGE